MGRKNNRRNLIIFWNVHKELKAPYFAIKRDLFMLVKA